MKLGIGDPTPHNFGEGGTTWVVWEYFWLRRVSSLFLLSLTRIPKITHETSNLYTVNWTPRCCVHDVADCTSAVFVDTDTNTHRHTDIHTDIYTERQLEDVVLIVWVDLAVCWSCEPSDGSTSYVLGQRTQTLHETRSPGSSPAQEH